MYKFYLGTCLNSDKHIKQESVDLFFCDPPYFISGAFSKMSSSKDDADRQCWDRQWTSVEEYYDFTKQWMTLMYNQLKPTGSAYICISWEHSGEYHRILKDIGFKIRNRITWTRDKGRGAKTNWKNMTEDIWFVTKSNTYTFNIDDIKILKEVVAPYRDKDGNPKDWFISSDDGETKLRYSCPGNSWSGVAPFWSSYQVKDYASESLKKHSTQKPEEILKLCIIASSNKGDLVVDYFSGSGTTTVVALALGRKAISFDTSADCEKMLENRLKNKNNLLEIKAPVIRKKHGGKKIVTEKALYNSIFIDSLEKEFREKNIKA